MQGLWGQKRLEIFLIIIVRVGRITRASNRENKGGCRPVLQLMRACIFADEALKNSLRRIRSGDTRTSTFKSIVTISRSIQTQQFFPYYFGPLTTDGFTVTAVGPLTTRQTQLSFSKGSSRGVVTKHPSPTGLSVVSGSVDRPVPEDQLSGGRVKHISDLSISNIDRVGLD